MVCSAQGAAKSVQFRPGSVATSCAAGAEHSAESTARRDKNAMAFVPAANVLMCEARWTFLGQQVENVTFWETAASPSSADAEAIAQAYESSWVANLRSLSSTDMSLRELYFTDLTTATAPTYTVVPGAPLVGTAGTASLPSNNAFCISFRTEGRGRSARGRNYLFGLVEGHVTGNTVSDTYANAAVSFFNAWTTAVLVSGPQPVVVSTRTNKQDRVAALVQPINAFIYTDQWVDVQRRRSPGRGT